jgi:hypothetical protein
MLTTQTVNMLDAEASLNAISLAQSLLDEIEVKAYDANSFGKRCYVNTDFTPSDQLGPSNVEANTVHLPDNSYPHTSLAGYNDVDDYNKYVRVDTTTRLNNFRDSVSVFYVTEADPNKKTTTRTFFKKIVVTVTHPSMKNPIQLADIAVYRRYF